MTQVEMDKNLIVVAAVEGYAQKHSVDTIVVLRQFRQLGLLDLLRSQYEALHTQNLNESVSFVEDVLARRS